MDKETFADYAVKSTIEDTLQEALDILDADDGKSFEEKKEALIKHLQSHKEPVLVDALADLAIADKRGQQLKDTFWSAGEVTCDDASITLRKVDDSDREGYLELQKEYSIMKGMLNEQAYPVDRTVYYPKYLDRDIQARDTYRKEIKKSKAYRDDIFILDILREEMSNDDPRIQRIVSE